MNKNEKILELQKRITKLEIEKHEKGFIHISWCDILRLFAFLGSVVLSILNFIILLSTWKLLNLGSLLFEQNYDLNKLLILYPLISQYILIGISIICFVVLIKGDFNKLIIYDEENSRLGLISMIIFGIIFIFIVSIISYFLGFFILGLICSMIAIITSTIIYYMIEDDED